jgi:hypothetical protein
MLCPAPPLLGGEDALRINFSFELREEGFAGGCG